MALSSSASAQTIIDRLAFPDDVKVNVFSDEVSKARHMAFDDQGVLFLSQARAGKIVALPDANNDGIADKKVTILKDGDVPHGLAFVRLKDGYFIYIAEQHRVIRMKRLNKPFIYGEPEVFIEGIPGGGHSTRTIKIRGGQLYLSVGSSCNVCEDSKMRAAIMRLDLIAKKGGIFASGLRNTVGMEFSPYTGKLWGVNNGRDMLGDDFPREELNIIEQGNHYGWPYCHNDRIPDPKFGKMMDCSTTVPPRYTFTAHMAPLGMAFYQKGNLPAKYDNSLFIAFHGSWNRSIPAGYKIVRVVLNDKGEIKSHEDFITGFLKGESKIGRPVDVEQSPQGDLYISDDYSGRVYRVTGRQSLHQ